MFKFGQSNPTAFWYNNNSKLIYKVPHNTWYHSMSTDLAMHFVYYLHRKRGAGPVGPPDADDARALQSLCENTIFMRFPGYLMLRRQCYTQTINQYSTIEEDRFPIPLRLCWPTLWPSESSADSPYALPLNRTPDSLCYHIWHRLPMQARHMTGKLYQGL